jgi:hypothetical protein
MFADLGIQYKIRMHHIVICDLAGSNIFLHYIIKGMIFVK